MDFGREVSKIMPLIIREVTKGQRGILSKGLVTIPQIVILDLLLEKSPYRMTELAKRLGLTKSAATATVDKMTKVKLVKRERSEEDRRVVNVTILKKGEQTIRRVNEERQDAANSIFSPLTKEDKQQYLKLLRKVYTNLGQRQ